MSTPKITSDPTVDENPYSITKAREVEAVAIHQAKILAEQQLVDDKLVELKEGHAVDSRDIADPKFATTPLAPLPKVVPADQWAAKRAQVEELLKQLKKIEAELVDDIKDVFAKFDDKHAAGRARLVDDLGKRIDHWLAARPADVNTAEVLRIKALLGNMVAPARLALPDVTDLDACFKACTNHVTHIAADTKNEATTVSSLVRTGVVTQDDATQIATERSASLEEVRQQVKFLMHAYYRRHASIAAQIAAIQATMPADQRVNLTTVPTPIAAAFLRACDSLRIEPSEWGGHAMRTPTAPDATITFPRTPTAPYPRSRVRDADLEEKLARLAAESKRPHAPEPSAPSSPSPFEINRGPVSTVK